MSDFSDKQWAGSITDIGPKTNKKSASQIHGTRIEGWWEGLEKCAQENEEAANRCPVSPPKIVGDVRREGEDGKATETRHGAVDTEC
jgi:hypothetical protein